MTFQTPSPRIRGKNSGMTLVELLIVMAIIGILIGILVPVLGPMLWRSSEYVIINEIKQLDIAIEQFNTDYGFYPPDFAEINTVNDLKPYLAKIAPNHTQTDAQLNTWMTQVGSNLDSSSAMVFWLSGLRNSAQFPLTRPDGTIIPAYIGAGDQDDRISLFEFKTDRLLINGDVAAYGQAKGNQALPYVFFKSAYVDSMGTPKSYMASTGETVLPYPVVPGDFTGLFHNNKSYQIIAPGLDGRYGTYANMANPIWTSVDDLPTHRDNLVNFSSQGRIDADLD